MQSLQARRRLPVRGRHSGGCTTGRDMSSSERRVFSSMRSSSSSSSPYSSSGASRSSEKSTKPTPAGWVVSGGPFFRLPFRLRETAPVPAGVVVAAATPSGFFLLSRRGTEWVGA